MAKKKIEDPEEGTLNTQKTNKEIRQEKRQAGKDIRQERRQMKATNDYRQSLGEKEKYYSKEEIRNVGKPVESKPSEVLTGTRPGVGNSSTTYNDPNAPSKTTYEYQKTGLSSKLGNKEVVEATPITAEQFTALNADDPNTGEAVRKAMTEKIITDNNTSLQDKMKILPATEVVEKEVQNTTDAIDDQVKKETTTQNTINTTDPNAIAPVGGSGTTVAKITEAVPPNQEEWTSLVTKGENYQAPSRDEIYEQARQAKVKAPQLVIEKLGLQDYYPEAGSNIAVGNFSGSYAGSRTIYSGAGGLLPLGLYDARKRAIAEEIKKKEALVDKLKEIPDIAKQFKPYFAEKHMEFLSPWLDAFKDKPEELMRNTDFLKGLRQQQSIAENFLKVNENFKALRGKLVTADGEPAVWANERMLKMLNNFNAGMLPGEIEKYFDGTKNISDLEKNIREIPDAYNQADSIVKQLMEKGAVETAINMKTGKDFSPDDIKEINSLVQQLKSTSPDYETYAQLKRKFFDFGYEDIAREWIEGHMPDLPKSEKDALIDSVSRYMFSQMPKDGIISTITNQANGYTERRGQDVAARTAANRLAFDKEQAKFDRENSQTLKDVQNLLADNKTVKTVQHAGAETTANGNDLYFHLRMDNGTTKRYKGSQIVDLQKQGHKFTGSNGGLFNVPGMVNLKPYETTYTKSGERVNGRTKAAAYTTSTDEFGKVTVNPINAVIDMGETEYTNSDGTFNTAKMTEKDVINYNKSPNNAAMGTQGGKTSTTNVSYQRN